MKKIMFNEEYGLQKAVLKGRKTMTRRMVLPKISVSAKLGEINGFDSAEDYILRHSYFKEDDVVAIAQSYEVLANSGCEQLHKMLDNHQEMKKEYTGAGWRNKMFVKAELMPHHILITKVKVEHLQDISDEDCMREGICGCYSGNCFLGYGVRYNNGGWLKLGNSPREAFASLIDKISGKGTWDSNPLVYVYEFELID